MLKAALHVHTKEDPRDHIGYSAKEAITKAAEQRFDVIAITCHDCVVDDEELIAYAEQQNILYIPGIEKTIEKKHVLIINANKRAEEIKTFADLAEYRWQKPNIFVIAPHPFYPGITTCLGGKLETYRHLFDAIEYSYFYTEIFNMFNKKAERYSQKYDLPLIGTSDVHLKNHFNHTWMWLDAAKNIPSVIQALRAKKFRMHTTPLTTKEMVWIYGEMLIRDAVGVFAKPFRARRIAKPKKTSTLEENAKRQSISHAMQIGP